MKPRSVSLWYGTGLGTVTVSVYPSREWRCTDINGVYFDTDYLPLTLVPFVADALRRAA